MHSTKIFLSVGSLAAGSLAQSFSSDPSCPSSIAALGAAAPPFPSYVLPILPDPTAVLKDPWAYASSLCAVAAELPASELKGFGEYGQSLLSFVATELSVYDAIVTKCYATGAEAAAATSYIHSIASQTAPLCQETSTPSGGLGSSNGTATITSAAIPTGTGSYPGYSTSGTSTVPIALAARPTGVLAGAMGAAGLLAAAALF
ncbi:hypothetical protein FHL15_005875 [Xylaria flabelliformis]|uniref:Infection structure specific protein n=1 Tax=Xylaria flabelliformis TaxID=2512241 RepID=A0A553HZA6_9PEZI|nr:hypothetical protein FHL15_005875 [Xylaria flabelliformis]